jgi:hypothetical protein
MPSLCGTLRKHVFLLGLMTSVSLPAAAMAADSADMSKQIELLQKQVELLQSQLKEVKTQQLQVLASEKKRAAAEKAFADKAAAEAPSAGAAKAGAGTAKPADAAATNIIDNKALKVTVGGYVEAAAIMRSRNETADMASNFSTGIPYPISPNYRLNEFRGSARQSRLSLLAQGPADANTDLAAYFESDFLGAAPTANSNESNSYNPRLRQVYATVDKNDWGFHFLGGQAWSLLTMNKKGITPRQENVPLVIEAQYVPGFTWTRNWQLRAVQDFDNKRVWGGISLESPQALIFSGPNTPTGSPTFNNPGGSGYASTNNYSTDVAPDVIAKLAFDPGYGHYEIYGIGRFFRDRNNRQNSTIFGEGGGAAALLPIIDKKLDFQIGGLIGNGVGRYGSTQLPDITIKPDGGIDTVRQGSLLAGFVGHPRDDVDAYLYGGTERAWQKDFTSAGGLGFGYGNPLYNNSGCNTQGAAANTCVANTKQISQLTAGFWWKFYRGNFGIMQVGAQDSYTKRYSFTGVGGDPGTDENVTMFSFRYYPF